MSAERSILDAIPAAESLKFQAGDITLHHVRTGSGPTLLLLHGLNMGWGQWFPNITTLARHFTVHAVDIPPAGNSSAMDIWRPDFPKRLIAAFGEFIDSIPGPVHMVGHSFGGWLALELALQKPDRVGKIIGLNPLGFHERTPMRYRLLGVRPIARFLAKTVMRMNHSNSRKFMQGVMRRKEKLPEEFVAYYSESLQQPGAIHPFLLINRFSGVLAMRPEFVFSSRLKDLQVPFLALLGANDPLMPFGAKEHALLGLIPGVTKEVLHATGHVPSIEDPAAFVRSVVEFIQ